MTTRNKQFIALAFWALYAGATKTAANFCRSWLSISEGSGRFELFIHKTEYIPEDYITYSVDLRRSMQIYPKKINIFSLLDTKISSGSTLAPPMQRLRSEIDENYERLAIDPSAEIEAILSDLGDELLDLTTADDLRAWWASLSGIQ